MKSGTVIIIGGDYYLLRYRDPGVLRPEDAGLWRADKVEWNGSALFWSTVDDEDYLISDDRRIVAVETGWRLTRK